MKQSFNNSVKLASLCLLMVMNISCSSSSDDDPSNVSTMSVSINGQTISYNIISTVTDTTTGSTTISGAISGDSENNISFSVRGGDLGTGATFSYDITYESVTYSFFNNSSGSSNSNIIVNDSQKIQGTFGPTTMGSGNGETITISNGQYEVFLD